MADLARLAFSDEELEAFTEEMNEILAYFEKLREVDTEGVEPAFRVLRREDVFREDRVGEMLAPERALAGAPDRSGNHFRVPAFLPDE